MIVMPNTKEETKEVKETKTETPKPETKKTETKKEEVKKESGLFARLHS